MKKQKSASPKNPFDFLSEELIFNILDLLDQNPLDKKSFSLVCKSFHSTESKHRRILKPLRSEQLPVLLKRYPFITHLNLSLCRRVTDNSLAFIAESYRETLKRIDLSQSKFFSGNGLVHLGVNCRNLVELDLSNATEMRDAAAAAVAEFVNLERLWLGRCKLVSDMGIGCIAVGCRKLRLICLKWCVGVGDLGVELIAIKCQQLRSLDLSYLPITDKCLPSIFKLQHLEDLVLEGCFGIDDDNLDVFKQGCRTLKKLDISGCQNITHAGLSALISSSGCIEQLTLADGSPVTLALADGLNKLSMLQSIILDGCLVTSSGLKAIGYSSTSIKELSLSKCLGVTDVALSFVVSKQRDLRKLDITCCRMITDISIESIANSCTSLTSLKMESCSLVTSGAFVLIGQRCHSLEHVDITDNEIDDKGLKSISSSAGLSSLKLGICLNITDRGLSYVGKCCSKLKELDLYRCTGVTDLGISAIACGCPELEMINAAYCTSITDSSLISLSQCPKLKTLEIRGCTRVTSIGLADIANKCRQLTRLDIKKCYNIDDRGMLSIACFSQNLRQINFSYSSITDLGILSLASLSSLQTFTVIHVEGLTPRGLAAALWSCGGLKKVKLHLSLKPLLSDPFIKHMEARGCVFEWRNKVFQAEVDPKCWKLQLEDPTQ